MNSGIEISAECVAAFKQCAMKRQLRYVVFAPNADGTAVEIEK